MGRLTLSVFIRGIVMPSMGKHSDADDLPLDPLPDERRSCDGCTACCTVLAVDELRKPMRWACDQLACNGCRIYDARPKGCRDFDCLWLRGEIRGNESSRPDRLGVIFDCFRDAATDELRFVAFEVWTGAFHEPATATLIAELAATREVQLSGRDGSWRTIGPRS
jgi:hypothetical protein